LDRYLYIWRENPREDIGINPNKDGRIWYKIETNVLPLTNKDYYDCYKIRGDHDSAIDHKVKNIVEKHLTILEKECRIEDNNIDHIFFKKDISEKNHSSLEELNLLVHDKYLVKTQNSLYNDLIEIYEEIKNTITNSQNSNTIKYLNAIHNKKNGVESEILDLEKRYNELEIRIKKRETRVNRTYFIVGIICGAFGTILGLFI
jgi:hypothetical protein